MTVPQDHAGLGPRKRTLILIAIAVGGLCALALLLQPVVHDGETHLTLLGITLPTTCWFKLTTGLPCAGCGLTRSMLLLLHGHPTASFAMHPFGPWIVALAVLAIPPRLARGRSRWTARWNRAWLLLAGLTLVTLLLWWILSVGFLDILSAAFLRR